ncbi:G_PROTEIN_RECEP_F1_2 domain-containing protein [Caenorhabditis elegans]|uniref:G_PROTEIN_RECEP_F1_2 domain-containing protein n=1 Tax=Caenorhabditis elegans TaxID=6239 RepID=Q95Y02_CAEEL|nr:G_PROTEIN_RECEP_F1_2 domain-containing protein [Caenorhabditis elegans]CCD66722.2 G_PROTEIN_RECEP_F1_2 domain-containing protein [Caenorhabditis elegans]|eukprot:NP_500119.3 Uncharacterized protein CELE_Y41D4B.1 [Caenorhabditis elegans]
MELTDPEEPTDLDSAVFALHSMHLAICTAALVFNAFLLYLIRKCSAFHPHMKIIMMHQTMAIIATDIYLFLRSSIGLWQTYEEAPLQVAPQHVDDAQCAFSSSVPDSLCVLFLWFPFLLAIERTYASQNYESYETNEFPTFVEISCGVMWFPVVSEIIIFVFTWGIPSNLQACQYSLLQKTSMQRNTWFVIIASFSVCFSVFFKLLEMKNKAMEIQLYNDYVFSARFQVRENIKTCRFACGLLLLFFTFFFIFFIFDRNLETSDESRMASAARREYLFLIFPMFALVYSLHFLTANSSLFETAKRTLQQYYYQEHERMLE